VSRRSVAEIVAVALIVGALVAFSNLNNSLANALASPGILLAARLLPTGYHDDRLLLIPGFINFCLYLLAFIVIRVIVTRSKCPA
jgi:hypothetical protein